MSVEVWTLGRVLDRETKYTVSPPPYLLVSVSMSLTLSPPPPLCPFAPHSGTPLHGRGPGRSTKPSPSPPSLTAALPYMAGVLAARPGYFNSVGEAIAWCGRAGMCRSKEAAAVSLPSQLMLDQEEGDEEEGDPPVGSSVEEMVLPQEPAAAAEEEEGEGSSPQLMQATKCVGRVRS